MHLRCLALSSLLPLLAAQQAPHRDPPAIEQDESGCRVVGATFEAGFDRDGARIAVAGDATGARPTLRLQLADWGGRPADANAVPTVGSGVVDFDRGGIVERYRILANGIEQRFVIAQRPATGGDLVIGIDVAGNVDAPARQSRCAPLRFVHGNGSAIDYGRAIAFDREGLQTEVASSFDGRGRIELTVPGAFVQRAVFPIVVDPVIGSAVPIGTSFFEDTNPAVAQDMSTVVPGYCSVWERTFSSSSKQIRARIYDRDGAPLTGELAITTTGVNNNPDVMWSGSRYFIAWDTVGGIEAAVIDSQSGALLQSVAVSSPPIGAYDRRPSIGSNDGPTFFLAWDHQPVGASAPRQIQVCCWQGYTQVAALPKWTLHTVTGGSVRNVRLPKATVTTTTPLSNYSYRTRTRAVWEQTNGGILPQTDVVTASFEAFFNSAPTSAGSIPAFSIVHPVAGVSGASSQFASERAPDIAARGQAPGQYMIVWETGGNIFGHFYSLMLGPFGSSFPIRSSNRYSTVPAVGAGVGEYSVVYHEADNSSSTPDEVRVARVRNDGTVPLADHIIESTTAALTARPRISSIPRAIGGGFQSNRNLIAWSASSGPSTGPTDLFGRMFEPVVPNEILTGVPCPGPGGMTATIGTAGGPAYAANEDYRITLSGALPTNLALLVISPVSQSSLIPGAPGCVLEIGLPFLATVPLVTNLFGQAQADLPMPRMVPHGALLAMQWAIYTPNHNALGWTTSDALELHFSHF